MSMENKLKMFGSVKAFAFDVDGVFTDGKIYTSGDGEFMRAMNIKDGYAVQYGIKKGYPMAIITGGNTRSVRKRFEKLGVTDIYLNSNNKLDNFEDFRFKYHLEYEEILYMGDDIPDYDIMKRVGLATCPANAAAEIKEISLYISDRKGGEGCVRDVIEKVLKINSQWLNEDAFAW